MRALWHAVMLVRCHSLLDPLTVFTLAHPCARTPHLSTPTPPPSRHARTAGASPRFCKAGDARRTRFLLWPRCSAVRTNFTLGLPPPRVPTCCRCLSPIHACDCLGRLHVLANAMRRRRTTALTGNASALKKKKGRQALATRATRPVHIQQPRWPVRITVKKRLSWEGALKKKEKPAGTRLRARVNPGGAARVGGRPASAASGKWTALRILHAGRRLNAGRP